MNERWTDLTIPMCLLCDQPADVHLTGRPDLVVCTGHAADVDAEANPDLWRTTSGSRAFLARLSDHHAIAAVVLLDMAAEAEARRQAPR